jgi:predicted GNAT family N-acyltransferase
MPRRSRSELGSGNPEIVRQFTHKLGDPEFRTSREVERDFRDTVRSSKHQQRLLDEWRRDLPDADKLNDEDMLAINRVTDPQRQMDINEALTKHDDSVLADHELELETAASGLNKLPDFHGPVRRGEYVDGAELEKLLDRYQVGRNVPQRGFTEWNKTIEPGGNVQFHLKSEHGKDISYGTHKDSVIHPPENHVRVEKRWFDQETDTWHIELSDRGRVPGLKDIEVPAKAPETVSRLVHGVDDAGGEVRVLDPQADADLIRDLKQQATEIARKTSDNPTVERGRKYLEQVFDDIAPDGERRIAVTMKDGKLLAAADFAVHENTVYVRLLASAQDAVAGRVPGVGVAALHAAMRTAREKGLPLDLFAQEDAKALYANLGFRVETHGGSAHLPAADTRWLVDEAESLTDSEPSVGSTDVG